jgi:prevent-host-death family protein
LRLVVRLAMPILIETLSALLDAVESGEDVEITRRGVPVARLTRPVACRQRPETELAESSQVILVIAGIPMEELRHTRAA